MKKCNMKKGIYCKAAAEYFQIDGGCKGLHRVTVINKKTYKHGHAMIYKPESRKLQYVWLNFCPFCGAKVI